MKVLERKIIIYIFFMSLGVIFFTDSPAYEKLCFALTNPSLMKGIKQASAQEQTSCLEGFHSVVNQYAPKMVAYTYPGMFCR
jgi:solute carrier family 8 (sodium/calcium exchanger)